MYHRQKKLFTKQFLLKYVNCIMVIFLYFPGFIRLLLFLVKTYTYRIHSLLRLLLLQCLFLPVWNKSAQQSSPAYAWIFVWYLPTCLESKLSEECKRNTICSKAEKDSRYFHFSPGSRLSKAVLLKMQHVSSCDFSFMAEQVFGVITSGWR